MDKDMMLEISPFDSSGRGSRRTGFLCRGGYTMELDLEARYEKHSKATFKSLTNEDCGFLKGRG